jgi:hypothetical protein
MPLIIGTDEENSAPGIPQPVIVTGGESLPPSFPLGTAGTWMPPPLVGEGGNVPFPTPVVPPGSGLPGVVQPQYATGGPLLPTAASWFPSYSAPGPMQPIILTNIMQIGLGPPPFTPGNQPITISNVPTIPQFPWVPFPPPPPTNSVPPSIVVITPPPTVGGQLAVTSNGTWTGSPSFARQWLRDGEPIAGQTTVGYSMVAADEGTMLSCRLTGTNAGGSLSVISNVIGPVQAPADTEEPTEPVEADPAPEPHRAVTHRAPAKRAKRR